jgi:hypothetical protein
MKNATLTPNSPHPNPYTLMWNFHIRLLSFFFSFFKMENLSLVLLLPILLLLLSSVQQTKTKTKRAGDGECRSAGQDLAIPARILAGWLGFGRSSARTTGDPALSWPERLDTGRLPGIWSFPGWNGSGPFPASQG